MLTYAWILEKPLDRWIYINNHPREGFRQPLTHRRLNAGPMYRTGTFVTAARTNWLKVSGEFRS